MAGILESVHDTVDSFLAWMGSSLKQSTESYCDLETADGKRLVLHDGSYGTMIRIRGAVGLVGTEEFERIYQGLALSLQTSLGQPGHALQVYFMQDRETVYDTITDIYQPSRETAQRLGLNLSDLFDERINYVGQYCADEQLYFVIWTRPSALTSEQFKQAQKEKSSIIRHDKLPPFYMSQNIVASYPVLRDSHDAFVRSVVSDLHSLGLHADVLDVHESIYEARRSVDVDYTSNDWRATLPGDKIPVREIRKFGGDVSDILWPPLSKQVIPRDAENLDMRTTRIGDKIFSSAFIELFPKDIKPFVTLFNRTLAAHLPWRISFLIESEGLSTIKLKGILASILSWTSSQNQLISDANNLLKYLNISSDDAMVRLRVSASTWAPDGNLTLLRSRASELAKALQGWGSCEVSEYCGDALQGALSSALSISMDNPAPASIAPLLDVTYMLPLTRPASQWSHGALLYRSPDGKPWPYQPGSREQTTWIDLIYARPGSGKSVLSNAINLGLCLQGGLMRLPRIAVIDIGPSSSGLISLLREALPASKRHWVAHYRLRMTPEYSINPFDTQLGCRFPNPSERAFLVNFLTLLATPVGSDRPYDAIPDLAGMVVDELYKALSDETKPHIYSPGIEPLIDGILEEIGFVRDIKTTWWEVTDALFMANFILEANTAQRYCMPLLADAASVCRSPSIEDLYGKITTPTGESLIDAFGRMISSSVREYPILSRTTQFDLGEARVVAMDLDEVAKSGGDAADRQTAVMYMLARYVLARHYYLTEETVTDIPSQYKEYHTQRIAEIRDDAKRIVYDEFHRTSKSRSVRDQVILDMREGRKWKVQIGLLSQSVDDFDPVMIEFATGVYIMDAGPSQAVQKTASIFGLSKTETTALRTRVHGPREGGATFLAQFATKHGIYTQLLTLTLGPIELWSFSTTAEDAQLRNKLYKQLGPMEARRILALLFPSGTVTKLIEERLTRMREENAIIAEDERLGMVDSLLKEILEAYSRDPNLQALPG